MVTRVNNKVKAGTIVLLLLAISGCSSVVPIVDTEQVKLEKAGLAAETLYIAEVSKNKGASFYFRIDSKIPPNLPIHPNLPLQKEGIIGNGGEREEGRNKLDNPDLSLSTSLKNYETVHNFQYEHTRHSSHTNPPLKGARGMSAKANTDGSLAKTPTDIHHYLVYLVRNASTTGFPAGGNPLANVVAGPFTVSRSPRATELIKFEGLQSSVGEAYYVAVRARDKDNNDLIKDNNGSATAWANANKKIAVSSGNGIVVGDDLQVSSTTSLSVTPNLMDAAGAILEANVTPNSGIIPGSVNAAQFGIITTFAGGGASEPGNGGPATDAKLNFASTFSHIIFPGVATDSSSNVYFADNLNYRVRKVDSSGTITTVAGNGTYNPGSIVNGINATDAALGVASDVTVDSSGNIYFSDSYTNYIRKVSAGIITTIAGKGTQAFSGDNGPATDADVNRPTGLAVDDSGNIYFSDTYNHRIRKINSSGIITTIAGSGTQGFSGDDGPATDADMDHPTGLAVDSLGNIYFSDTLNHRVRKINSSGVITTIAGNGTPGFSGDGVSATDAVLNNPVGIAIDGTNNIYFSDMVNYLIRKIDSSGIITTIAGNGSPGISGNNVNATEFSLYPPTGLAINTSGNIYFAETITNRIRKVEQ